MSANLPPSLNVDLKRPAWLPIYRWLAILTSVLVLIQAILAGQGWFKDTDFIDYHEILANILFLVVVAQVVATWLIGIPGDLGRRLLWLNVLLLALLVVQIGLGYGDSEQARAWHVPNGVLIFGLTITIVALVERVFHRSEAR